MPRFTEQERRRRKAKATALLLAGKSAGEVARAVGISVDALRMWRKDPFVRDLLEADTDRVRGDVLEAVEILRAGAPAAARTLATRAADGDVNAARLLLQLIGIGEGVRTDHHDNRQVIIQLSGADPSALEAIARGSDAP